MGAVERTAVQIENVRFYVSGGFLCSGLYVRE